jgi:hypothetical protein
LLWLFWRWSLSNYLPGLASNCDPPGFSLLSSQDYRRESPAPGYRLFFKENIWYNHSGNYFTVQHLQMGNSSKRSLTRGERILTEHCTAAIMSSLKLPTWVKGDS